jgi:hypothetical protein
MNSTLKSLMAMAIVTLAWASGAARAQLPPAIELEGSVETTTDAVIFPSGLDGRVTVRGCEGCLHSTLQLDKDTRCILAGQTVSLRDMAAFAGRSSARQITITYRLHDLIVSRIIVLEK